MMMDANDTVTTGEHTTWGSISAGDVVEGTNSSMWSVVKRGDTGVTVMNVITGKEVTQMPPDDKPVVRVAKAQHALSMAKALTKVMLGGEELGTRERKNGQDQWLCPIDYEHPGTMASHLLIWHSVFGKAVAGRPLPELQSLHAAVHLPSGRAGGYTDHVHTPDYLRVTSDD